MALVVAIPIVAMPLAAMAQTASPSADQAPPPPKKHKPDPYASPLDTILSTRLWTDVPPAQDFVKESRPDPKTLEYAPLVGNEPARPKPRDAAGIAALQAELESGGEKNDAMKQDLLTPPPPPPVVGAKPAPKPARHARKPTVKKPTSVSSK